MATSGLKMKNSFLILFGFSLLAFPLSTVYAEAGSINVLEHNVSYDIDNGEVIDIYADPDFVEIVVDFVSIDDGVLEITIPRALLDSKISETEDDIFFVIVNQFETEYVELDATATTRTLLIPFFSGDETLEIIGTNVLDDLGLFEEPSIEIPSWIKNNAGWWSDGQIGDTDFVSGIQYLITEGIMTIPPTEAGTPTSQAIPDWIKNNAGWWSDGQISDTDFVSGIQYLISNGIMVI